MQKYILVVDDDALMRRSVAYNLEQAGYRPTSAGNAGDALEMSRRDQPALAGEAVQRGILSAYQSLPAFRGGSLRAWMLSHVTRAAEALDLRKAAKLPGRPLNRCREALLRPAIAA